MIATMTGGLPVLELFARANAEHALPADWEVWGNQATFNTAALDEMIGFTGPAPDEAIDGRADRRGEC
jgi:hypothetical protein